MSDRGRVLPHRPRARGPVRLADVRLHADPQTDGVTIHADRRAAGAAVAPGIYRTAAGGFRVVACIGRGARNRRERAFPAGTALRTMARWQEDTRRELRDRPKRLTDALLADLEDRYLPAIAAMPTKATRERHLRLWLAALGAHRTRDTVTGPEVRAVLERWRGQGAWSLAYLNRLRTALMHFYTVLNGPSGANPVRDVPKYRERRRPPKPLDYPTFERILAAMPDRGPGVRGETRREVSQTKARLRVIAYTGLPHAQVARLRPEHIRWEDRLVYVLGRDKGEGTDDVWLPVSQAGLAALRAFVAADAWGPFSTSSMRVSFRRAATALGRPDLTPYDLRHLFGTVMLRLSRNRAAVRDLLLHTTDLTTARYAAAAIPDELRAAIAAFDAEVVGPGCGDGSPTAAADTSKSQPTNTLRP